MENGLALYHSTLVSIPFIAGQWSLRADLAEARGEAPRVSIPFIAGQWSLLGALPPAARPARVFQSPSLRGSGRFLTAATLDMLRSVDVSIPFIAGQWSLRVAGSAPPQRRVEFQSPSLRGSGRFPERGRRIQNQIECFNPLHCGAVVASRASRVEARGG